MARGKIPLFRYYTYLLLLFSVSYCSLCFESMGEEPGKTPPTYLMEEIVVADTVRTSASEVSIDDDRIQTLRADTMAEVLSHVPGATVTFGHKNSSEIMIRGFSSRDVLVMVDGRPVNEPYYGTIDLSTLSVGGIAKVKVAKGATSVRFGPNAMGGAVNIVTDEGGDGTIADVRVSAGSGKEFRTDIMHGIHTNGIGYRIHLGRTTNTGFPLSSDFQSTSLENGDIRNNSDYRRTDLSAKLLFGPRDNYRWRLNMGGSHLVKGLPSSIYEARFWRFRKWNRMYLGLDGEPIRRSTFRLKTKVYVDRFYNELVDYRDEQFDLSNVFWISTHDNRSAGLLLSSSYVPGGNGVSNFGMQIRWDESRRQADKGEGWYINRTATSWIFTEYERHVRSNVLIRGGLSGMLFSSNNRNSTEVSFNPSLHLEWSVAGNVITGSVSRVSRFPTLHQLFSGTSGNPDLNPEWAYKGELSVSRTLTGGFSTSVTVFANRVYDLIYRSGRLNRYHNVREATLDGVEISGIVQKLTYELYSSVTMLDAHDGYGERLEYRPRWKVDVFFTHKLFRNTRFYLSTRAAGRRRTEIDTNLDPYHVENAGIILFEKREISSSLHLKNVFDCNYENEYGYPDAGRTILLGIDWRWSGMNTID